MADFEVFPSADWESTLSDLGLISEMSVFHPLPPYTSDMFDSLSPESISMTPESLGLYDKSIFSPIDTNEGYRAT